MKRLLRVGTVVFDCDSTLCATEGIEELARMRGASVRDLTEAVMRGEVPMEEVFSRRLAIVQPAQSDVETLKQIYIDKLVPDARETVRALLDEGIQVRIMSAGVRAAVEAVGAELGLSPRHVAGVDISFDAKGEYDDFDVDSPLARAFGKRDLLRVWRSETGGSFMMVGDGATDLEAADAADVFVAYAGVVERPAIVAEADVVIRSPSLAPVLPLALAGETPRRVRNRALFDKGLGLLEAEYRSYLPYARNVE
ncbi:MAG: HAD-IB family phosphatase [Longimicrobiales bacterium]